jgi:type III pantothenate kinase
MIVELDIGNTRIKWRILDKNNSPIAARAISNTADLDLIAPDLTRAPVRVRVSSVAGSRIKSQLIDWAIGRWGVDPVFASVGRFQAGVTNSYADPERMGIDRWLAMLAAYNRSGGAVCVIDCGSAITVDLIAVDGHHKGGYIMPGLKTVRSALLEDTEEIRAGSEGETGILSPGTGTEQAVSNGALLMFVGAVQKALQQCDWMSRARSISFFFCEAFQPSSEPTTSAISSIRGGVSSPR